jgi:hypothetical protein
MTAMIVSLSAPNPTFNPAATSSGGLLQSFRLLVSFQRPAVGSANYLPSLAAPRTTYGR